MKSLPTDALSEYFSDIEIILFALIEGIFSEHLKIIARSSNQILYLFP